MARRLSALLALCAVLLFVGARAADDVDDPDVIVLTDKNFDSIVNSADIILVEFYAPWCGHCKHLAPEYAKAATALKSNDPPIKLAKLDATEHGTTASKFDVRGYPTLKIFRNGQASDYQGPREANGIISYMKKQAGPSSLEIKDVSKLEEITSRDEPIIIGYFTSEGAAFKEFMAAANTLRDKFKFAHSTNAAVLDKAGYREAVVLYKPYDEKTAVFPGTVKASAIEEWIFKSYLPLAGVLSRDNLELYQRRNQPVLRVISTNIDEKKNKKQVDYYLNRLRKAAKDFTGLSFTVADKTAFGDHDRFGLTGEEKDAIVIEDHAKNQKFRFTGEKFSTEAVKKFAQDWKDGKLKPHIKTEPRPAAAKKGEVTVVTGETFNEVVLDSKKDVLIEFYAPWCGHCKTLAPKYDKLAEELKDVDSVVIAKMDATANDIPHSGYEARGYPTILFAPANNKDRPMKYEGEREVKAFKKWLKEKASIPFPKK